MSYFRKICIRVLKEFKRRDHKRRSLPKKQAELFHYEFFHQNTSKLCIFQPKLCNISALQHTMGSPILNHPPWINAGLPVPASKCCKCVVTCKTFALTWSQRGQHIVPSSLWQGCILTLSKVPAAWYKAIQRQEGDFGCRDKEWGRIGTRGVDFVEQASTIF